MIGIFENYSQASKKKRKKKKGVLLEKGNYSVEIESKTIVPHHPSRPRIGEIARRLFVAPIYPPYDPSTQPDTLIPLNEGGGWRVGEARRTKHETIKIMLAEARATMAGSHERSTYCW